MAERRLEIELRAKTEQWERDLQRASQRVEELANRAAAAGLTMDQRFEKEIEEADRALVKLIQDARNLKIDVPPEAARGLIGMRLRLEETRQAFQQVAQTATQSGGTLAAAISRNTAMFGQLSFALQDFIAVMSQPGMGLNAALRASANNFAMLAMTIGGPLTGAISAIAITAIPMLVSALGTLAKKVEDVDTMMKRLKQSMKEAGEAAVRQAEEQELLEQAITDPQAGETLLRRIRTRIRAISGQLRPAEQQLEELRRQRAAAAARVQAARERFGAVARMGPGAAQAAAEELRRLEAALAEVDKKILEVRRAMEPLEKERARLEELAIEAERRKRVAEVRKQAEEAARIREEMQRREEERKRREQERQQREQEQALQREVNRWVRHYAEALRHGGAVLQEVERVIRDELKQSGLDVAEAMKRLKDAAEKLAEQQERDAELEALLRGPRPAGPAVAPAAPPGRPPATPKGAPAEPGRARPLAGAGLTFQQLVRRRAARLRRLEGLSPREALARAREELGIELENRMLQARGQAEEALIGEIVAFGRERGIELDPLRLRELVQTGRIDPAQLAGLTLEERRAIFRRVSAFRQRMRGLRADVLQGRMPVGAGIDAMAQVPQAAQRAADAAQRLEQQQADTSRVLLKHLDNQARALTNLAAHLGQLALRVTGIPIPNIPPPRRGNMR